MAKPTSSPQPRRGRPVGGKTRQRSNASREAILAATLGLLDDRGYAALTIEQVADRARTGKATIYRGWTTKARLVFDAIYRRRWEAPTPAGSEEAVNNLEAFLVALCRGLMSANTGVVLAALMVEAHTDPVLRASLEGGLLGDVSRSLEVVLRRGIDCGQLRDDLDVPLAADCLLGVIWHRLLNGRAVVDVALVGRLLSDLNQGWAKDY